MIEKRLFRSSIGRKVIIAITGAGLVLFVVGHLLGNLSIFFGQDAINQYAVTIKSVPGLLWTARILLLIALLIHMAFAIRLTIENRLARPSRYAVNNVVQTTLAARTMALTGLLIFFFIVFHLLHFTLGQVQPNTFDIQDAQGRHDVYSMMIYGFMNPWYSALYIVAMFVLCAHLSHGIQSVLQTFGIANRHNLATFRKLSTVLAVLIFLAFISMPIAVLLNIISLPAGG